MDFDVVREELSTQFENIKWFGGKSEAKLRAEAEKINSSDNSFSMKKSLLLKLIAENSDIAIDKKDIFQNKLSSHFLIAEQRAKWEKDAINANMKAEQENIDFLWNESGALLANPDFGHNSPNSRALVKLGFSGLVKRLEDALKKDGLTEAQKDFYKSAIITAEAYRTLCKRLADAIEEYNPENAVCLRNIADNAPKNIYEAMQLIIVYFFTHEYVTFTRVRTLGRLDILFFDLYKNDIASGTFTKEQITEMLKYFLCKFWTAKVPYDMPFCIGGMNPDGSEATNELSYLIAETYDKLNIYSPKIHVRVSKNTPADFVKLILRNIRGGNSSFVFINDDVCIKSLMRVGISEEDARDYTPIGCYEPAVWGVEMGSTGNGGINLGKCVELVFTNGTDVNTGKKIGVETGKIESYEDFAKALKSEIKYLYDVFEDYIIKVEKLYKYMTPDPMLSAMYDSAVEKGTDVYEGGAKYNNTSSCFYSIASLTDSVCAVKKLVFEDKKISFDDLCKALKNNWKGFEDIKKLAKELPEKYGNDNEYADSIAKEFAEYCSKLSLGKPNGRGGVFKPAMFTIDTCFAFGSKTMATPDGRNYGDPLSKNFCATTGCDTKGITALINSVTKTDHSLFPNGTVLDIVLHPSAVAGEDGLEAFYYVLMTYIKKGGYAMHGNIFDAKVLREAQQNPEKYKNLQVRVCGWNAYFCTLSKPEQDAFIKQSELAQ